MIQTTMAAGIEEASVNMGAASSSVLSHLENIQRTALKAFVGGNDVSALLPTGLGTSIKMTDKWFIQSYARIFDKAQPSKTPLQWSDPRWMSRARWNEIHLTRVRQNIDALARDAFTCNVIIS